MALTDEEKESLSPEEIAAMEEEEGDGDKADAAGDDNSNPADKEGADGKKASGNSSSDDSGADKEGDDKIDEDDKGEAGKGKEETDDDKGADADKDKKDDDSDADDKGAAKEDDKGAEEASSEHRPFTPKFTGVDQAELDGLKGALDEAKKKFDDGDIDYTVFDQAKDAYNEAKWKADFAQESNQNMQEGRWQWEQERFLDDNKQYRDNQTLNAAFVATVNSIIVTNEGKKLSDKDVLVRAKKQVEADLGIAGVAEKKIGGEKQKAIDAAKKTNADRSKIPADIGGLPAAEENEDVGEFAYLDKLEGEKFQAAVDKLTPEQLRKYEDS